MRIRIQQLKLMRIHADPDPDPKPCFCYHHSCCCLFPCCGWCLVHCWRPSCCWHPVVVGIPAVVSGPDIFFGGGVGFLLTLLFVSPSWYPKHCLAFGSGSFCLILCAKLCQKIPKASYLQELKQRLPLSQLYLAR
jgi:hypothetical protein